MRSSIIPAHSKAISSRSFDTVHTLNLGGGLKVGRMPDEPTTDLQLIGARVVPLMRQFHAQVK